MEMKENRSETAIGLRNQRDAGHLSSASKNKKEESFVTQPLCNSRNTPLKQNVKNNNKKLLRARSAPPSSRQLLNPREILKLRGKNFQQNDKTFDMTSYLREKSFSRRVHRLMYETAKEDTKSVDFKNIPQAFQDCGDVVIGNQLLDKRRDLQHQRTMNLSWVRRM